MTGPTVALLPGDGIGPEVVEAARRVLDAATAGSDLELRYVEITAGGAAIDAFGTPLRNEDLAAVHDADAALLGAVGGPRWDDLPVETRPERALLRLRSSLALGINLRPVTWTAAGGARSPLRPVVGEGTDIAFVRELTGGVYFGHPSYRGVAAEERYAVDTAYYNERQIEDVVAFAFRLARARRGTVTSVDKANVMNTSRLWREVTSEYARRYPDVTLEHALVDSFAMALIQNPRRYDVVVTENLFGDILTDLAGVIAGSLGVLPSASLHPRTRFGLYEPIHGSAPDIAGLGIANPAGCILSAALMLRWSFQRHDLAARVESAVSTAIARGVLTADLAADAPASTETFTNAVIGALREGGEAGDDRDLRYDVA